MTDQATTSERTAGGLLGRIVGKAKEVTGSLVGNDDLAREGRLQQARVDAEDEAGVTDAEAEQRGAEATPQQESALSKAERGAEHERLGVAQEAVELQQQARRATTNAQAIHPGEKR